MLRIVPFFTLALCATAAAPASAEWHRASAPHFIIYADDSPDKLKAFAEKLERFDKAVRVTRSMKDPPNTIDPEDPEPLFLFYQSYRNEKILPTANAIAALHYTAALAPQDSALRLGNARQFLSDGKPAAARQALVPLAYNPHGGSLAEEARRLIGLIDSGQVAAAASPAIAIQPVQAKK